MSDLTGKRPGEYRLSGDDLVDRVNERRNEPLTGRFPWSTVNNAGRERRNAPAIEAVEEALRRRLPTGHTFFERIENGTSSNPTLGALMAMAHYAAGIRAKWCNEASPWVLVVTTCAKTCPKCGGGGISSSVEGNGKRWTSTHVQMSDVFHELERFGALDFGQPEQDGQGDNVVPLRNPADGDDTA